MSHLPDFNPKGKSRGMGGGDRWYDEGGAESDPSPINEREGSEGELKESGYDASSSRCGWIKRNKWIVLLITIVLVIIIVLVSVLVPRRGNKSEPASQQVGSSASSNTTTEPTSPPTATNTSSPAPNKNQTESPVFSPTVLLSPVQAPSDTFPSIMLESNDTGKILNQFGEVFGYIPDGNVISLSSAVSRDGNTVALMNRLAPGNATMNVSVYRFNGEWRKLGQDIVGEGDISINGIGQALALDQRGNTLVVGFFNAACDVGENCGRVQVHQFQNGTWSQLGSDVIGEAANSYLGLSVAISNNGRTIVAGAPYNNGDNGEVHLGKVRVLRFAKGEWESLGTDLQGDEMRDQLGNSVALSADGNIVACGAPQGGLAGKTGYVKVVEYDESSGSFKELGSIIAGQEGLEQFGVALALSFNGTKIAVSAFNGRGSGRVCVFTFEDIAWIKLDEDIESPAGRFNLFGYSVDIDANGNRVIVGSPDSNGMAGTAYLFQLDKRGWQQRGEIIRSSLNQAQLGRSVSVSSSGTIVSAGGQYGAQIYYDAGIEGPTTLELEGFTQVGDIIGGKIQDTTFIGSSISGDGTTVAVGAREKSGDIIVRVLFFDPATGWAQIGSDITGKGSIDAVGKSIALSKTGQMVVVGFYNEACDAGENCGHVRVYTFAANTWNQVGQDIVGTTDQGFLGWSVAMSNDGLTVAAGAPISHGDDGTDHPGKVKVFRLENSTWVQVGSDLEGDAEWDHLGSSTALSGDGTYLAAGAVQGVPENLGYVKVFKYEAGTNEFIQVGQNLRGDNRTDKFGDSVSLNNDGLTLVVGADRSGTKDDAEARSSMPSFGSAYVFRNKNNTYNLIGNVMESGRTGDMYGYSVDISASGDTVVVGAPEDYSNSGSVYVYYYDENQDQWIQHGEEIYPEEEGNTQVGRSVAISKKGDVVIVGGLLGAEIFQLDFTTRSENVGSPSQPFAPSSPSAPFASPASFPVTAGAIFFSPAAAPALAPSGPTATKTDDGSVPGAPVGNPGVVTSEESPAASPISPSAPLMPPSPMASPFASPNGVVGGMPTGSVQDAGTPAPVAVPSSGDPGNIDEPAEANTGVLSPAAPSAFMPASPMASPFASPNGVVGGMPTGSVQGAGTPAPVDVQSPGDSSNTSEPAEVDTGVLAPAAPSAFMPASPMASPFAPPNGVVGGMPTGSVQDAGTPAPVAVPSPGDPGNINEPAEANTGVLSPAATSAFMPASPIASPCASPNGVAGGMPTGSVQDAGTPAPVNVQSPGDSGNTNEPAEADAGVVLAPAAPAFMPFMPASPAESLAGLPTTNTFVDDQSPSRPIEEQAGSPTSTFAAETFFESSSPIFAPSSPILQPAGLPTKAQNDEEPSTLVGSEQSPIFSPSSPSAQPAGSPGFSENEGGLFEPSAPVFAPSSPIFQPAAALPTIEGEEPEVPTPNEADTDITSTLDKDEGPSAPSAPILAPASSIAPAGLPTLEENMLKAPTMNTVDMDAKPTSKHDLNEAPMAPFSLIIFPSSPTMAIYDEINAPASPSSELEPSAPQQMPSTIYVETPNDESSAAGSPVTTMEDLSPLASFPFFSPSAPSAPDAGLAEDEAPA